MNILWILHPLRSAFLAGVLLSAQYCHAQTDRGDTAQAEILVKRAMEYHYQIEYDSSIVSLQKAARIFLKAKSWERYVHCLNIIADCLLRKVSLDSMEVVLHQAQDVERKELEPNNLECALTYSLTGLLYIYREKFDVAIENILDGKTIREEKLGRAHKYVAASNYLLGFAYLRKGDFDKALGFFKEALNIYSSINDDDHFNLSLTFLGIGYVSFLRSDFDVALSNFVKAYSLVSNSEKKYLSVVADCHMCLGLTYFEKGDHKQANTHLTLAVNLYRKLFGEDNLFLAGCYSRLGSVSEAEGDLDKAIEYYQKAISLEKKYVGDKHSFIALDTRQLGLAYANKNDLDEALQYSEKALTIHQKVVGNKHPDLAYTYEILGNIYKKRSEYSSSLKNFQKAFALRSQLKKSNDRNDIANLYSEIGSVYSEMKKFDRALEYYNKALHIHNNLPEPNRPQRAATLKGIGDVYAQLSEPTISLQYYQQAINTLSRECTDTSIYANPTESSISNCKDLIEILSAKAAAFKKYYSYKSHALRDLQAALATYECAANLLNMLRKKITTESSKLFLEEQSYSLYQNAILVSMKLFKATGERRYQETAFYFAENSKANVLLDGLYDSKAQQFSGIPDSIIEKERLLKIDLVYNETQLQKENDKKQCRDNTKITTLQDKCFSLNNETQRLSALLENRYPQYYELKYKNHAVTISEIQIAIDERTGVIEYCVGQHSLTIFVITKSSFDVYTIPTPSNFNYLTSTFYKAIKTIREMDYIRTGSDLYTLLFRPLEKQISGKKRIIIIPDGTLYYIPFEALIANAPRQINKAVDFTKLEYLLKSYEVSYSYSSSFYLNRLQQKGTTTTGELSFVGFAPVFRDTGSNGIFLSNNATALEKDPAVLRSITVDGKRFSELKYSEREVSLVAEVFQKKGKPATSFLYDNASEENFKMNVGKYSCIHIATHGYINEEHPQLSMLLFSQPQNSLTTEDGVLYASEMYNLNLKADLLVLSSCQSGLGKYVKGEGVIAMTRGFFYSGVHNIIFSLWKVYDNQTNELMINFYKQVLEGETFSSALRKSKLQMIADPSTAFPSKWSGFVLVGK